MSATIVDKCLTDISWDRFYISKQGFKVFTDFRVFF
ncbi:Uncharacterised protein [Mycobacterium tuberculosis]|nr:Uncharacterised protein [Mycobacterium tuberculosis]